MVSGEALEYQSNVQGEVLGPRLIRDRSECAQEHMGSSSRVLIGGSAQKRISVEGPATSFICYPRHLDDESDVSRLVMACAENDPTDDGLEAREIMRLITR
jgi:hypothetical protein